MTAGSLIAFEGLDQSGKQTQAERLAAWLRENGRRVHVLSFPDYDTAIGGEIGRGLQGERDYAAFHVCTMGSRVGPPTRMTRPPRARMARVRRTLFRRERSRRGP